MRGSRDGELQFHFLRVRNAENIIVLPDPAVAQRYAREGERLWRGPEEMKALYSRSVELKPEVVLDAGCRRNRLENPPLSVLDLCLPRFRQLKPISRGIERIE